MFVCLFYICRFSIKIRIKGLNKLLKFPLFGFSINEILIFFWYLPFIFSILFLFFFFSWIKRFYNLLLVFEFFFLFLSLHCHNYWHHPSPYSLVHSFIRLPIPNSEGALFFFTKNVFYPSIIKNCSSYTCVITSNNTNKYIGCFPTVNFIIMVSFITSYY